MSSLFISTSFDRCIQGNLLNPWAAQALDAVNSYQREKASLKRDRVQKCAPGPHRAEDPRIFVCEFLKEWLRAAAIRTDMPVEELDRMLKFCMGIILEESIFPSTRIKSRGFIATIKDVHHAIKKHQVQRKQQTQTDFQVALCRGQSCNQTLKTLQTHSRNLVEAACAFVLVGLTDLAKTDKLPGLGAQTLWFSLPEQWNNHPGRPDLQHLMKDAWATGCGRIVAALVSSKWFVQLQQGSCMKECTSVHFIVDTVRRELERGFRNSGFTGLLRLPEHAPTCETYFEVCLLVDDIAHFSCVLDHCHPISHALGDYGIIRMANWLHPLLDEMVEKVHQLQCKAAQLNAVLENNIVLAGRVHCPQPTDKMRKVAVGAIHDCEKNSQLLLDTLQILKQQSDPQRLNGLKEGCVVAANKFVAALQADEMRRRVSADFRFPELFADPLAERPAIEIAEAAERFAIQTRGGDLLAVDDAGPPDARKGDTIPERREHSTGPPGSRRAAATRFVQSLMPGASRQSD